MENITDREIISTRIINYPHTLVFKAWQSPAHLAQWFGPKGFTNTFEEFNFKPGGDWRFIMHGPDGKNYPNHTIFEEIIDGERIVYNHISIPKFKVTVTFEDMGDGKTNNVFKMLFETAEVREKLKALVVPANEENFDRLEAELAKMAIA